MGFGSLRLKARAEVSELHGSRLRVLHKGGCQNYGPFLGSLRKIRHLIFRAPKTEPEFRQLLNMRMDEVSLRTELYP